MTKIRLPYIKAYKDRHGRRRYYFRCPGCPTVTLPGEPGSPEFLTAYNAAREAAPRELGVSRNKAGSFGALIALYYKSGGYKDLAEITKKTYRNDLERFRAKHGEMSVKAMERKHVSAMLDAIVAQGKDPKSLRRILGILLTLAHERGWRQDNPMVGMRRPRKASDGFRAWDDEDIAKFEEAHQAGSRERLALALLLYTGQRRQDVVGMGRQHVKSDTILVATSKSGGRTKLAIPIHPRLKAEIDAAAADQLTFLQTQYGAPFSAAGFGNWFSETARDAGLPARSAAHGLRKASLRRLAEAGCTPHQIMAISGHKNLSEVTLYTKAVDQERLAREAMAKTEGGTELSTPENPDCLTAQNAQ
jgi:integrase